MPALIFDLDGTLVDTAPDLLGATNAVLAGQGRTPIDPASLRHMVGFGARSLITQAMAATGAPAPEQEMAALVADFIAHYRDHIADFSRPFPGVQATLKQLRAEGMRLGVLTNKPADLTRLLLDRLGMAEDFAAVYGAGSRPYTKPDPRIFHDVVSDLYSPEGGGGPAIMVGDSVTDLSTARAANAPCILVSYGYTPVPVAELGADLVLEDFTALPKALARFSSRA
jgi:phosphoglycolate phosphatase